jgi:asparagine synthase (glutamine-hydrolysing)
MCGIVGILHTSGTRDIDRNLLGRMNDSQSHRGPDDFGLYTAPGIGLGHRRLSIIDLAGGHQPMFNEDETVAVVYNGEIYNFQDLANILESHGHRFRTRCDTEVIVHAWEEWGEACVERFRGMFAFALWDSNRQTLFLARDRLGIKPLYYAMLGDGTLIFSSELKGLLVHPDLPRRIDPRAVEDYFAYGYVPDPKTIYRDVAKLAPAHVLCVRRGDTDTRPRPYWNISFRHKHQFNEDQAQDELIERLREAVDIRLIADVPLGAFLSGGVDSSAVVALMAQLSKDPVETCSIAFDDAAFDEARFASMVAEHVGARHHVRRVDPSEFDLVDKLANVYDEPFADSSALPTYRVCALGRELVTVTLSGDGGDEVFAGYRRYRWHHYEEMARKVLPQSIRGPLFGLLGSVYPKLDWAPKPLRAKSTFQALAKDTTEGYFDSVSVISDGLRKQLYSGDMARELDGYHAAEVLRHHMRNAPADHHLDRVQYADMKTYLPGDILTKVDRASMANSLEVRVPLLDHPFLEWAAGLPAGLKLRGGEGKYIFKKASERLVPPEVLYREKMGFSVPLASWFRGPLRDRTRDALMGSDLAASGMVDTKAMESLFRQHESGMRDHSSCLWSLIMFESFLRQVHGRHSVEPASVGGVSAYAR